MAAILDKQISLSHDCETADEATDEMSLENQKHFFLKSLCLPAAISNFTAYYRKLLRVSV